MRTLTSVIALALLLSLGAAVMGCSPAAAPAAPTAAPAPAKAAAPAAPAAKAVTPQRISIATSYAGSNWYVMGAGLAEVLKKAVPGLEVNVEPTEGSRENVRRVHQGQAEMGLSDPVAVYDAYTATGTMAKEKVGFNILSWFGVAPTYVYAVASKASKITTAAELKGKRISVGSSGGASNLFAMAWLEANGVGKSDFTALNLNLGEAVPSMKDGQIDALMWWAPAPIADMIDLTTTTDVVFIPIEKAAVDRFLKAYPQFWLGELKAGVYRGLTAATPALVNRQCTILKADLDENLVYSMTKGVFENLPDLYSRAGSWKDVTLEAAVEGLVIPLPSGAVKYYREKNVPGLDKFLEQMKGVKKAG